MCEVERSSHLLATKTIKPFREKTNIKYLQKTDWHQHHQRCEYETLNPKLVCTFSQLAGFSP